MKNFVLLLAIFFGFTLLQIQAQETTIIETEGNLESPNPCNCVPISEINQQHNPADIYVGMRKCIEQKDYAKAARLFAIAGVFGRFDTFRVQDKTAHQALVVLQQNTISTISEEDRKIMVEQLKKVLEKNSSALDAVCQEIQKVGTPTYHPKYMIQQGMQAFLNPEGDGLVPNFNPKESWKLALNSYLNCE